MPVNRWTIAIKSKFIQQDFSLTTQSESNIPQSLWRLAWASLIAVIVVGVVTLIVLSNGAADPHRAGPLAWRDGAFNEGVQPNGEYPLAGRIVLPDAPYTLEIVGRTYTENDPAAAWGISFDPTSSGRFGVYLNGYDFFSIRPFQSDFRPFIHIRSGGQENKIAIDVAVDTLVTVRINDEIAWQGKVVMPNRAHLYLVGGPTRDSYFLITELALYAPQK